MSTESAKDRMIKYARAVSAAKKDAWSEVYIFENYDDSDSQFLTIKLSGMTSSLKMNKARFYNYPEVLNKIQQLNPGQSIRYRTILKTNAGNWKANEWFSDIKVEGENNVKNTTLENDDYSKFIKGAFILEAATGKGEILKVDKKGQIIILTIRFESIGRDIRKPLNLKTMTIIH